MSALFWTCVTINGKPETRYLHASPAREKTKKETPMKKHYDPPEIEVILVKNEDILTGSNDLEDLENPFALTLD